MGRRCRLPRANLSIAADLSHCDRLKDGYWLPGRRRGCASAAQSLYCSLNRDCNLEKGLIAVNGLRDGSSVRRCRVQLAEGRAVPLISASYDRNDDRFTTFVPFHGDGHFAVVAVVGIDEIRTYEKEDDVSRNQVLTDRLVDLLASSDSADVPSLDHTLSAKDGQLLLELIAESFVRMRIRKNTLATLYSR